MEPPPYPPPRGRGGRYRFACRAIFFDAGNTLFHPYPSVGEIYAQVASRYGIVQPPDVLQERFHRHWRNRGGMASLEGPATPGLERRWWRSLVKDVFSEIASDDRFERFFDELYHTFGQAQNWRLYPEVRETLSRLKSKGFILGIISNWDSRLLALCRQMDLEAYFDFILISAVIGHSKPGEKIFQNALTLAGCAPEEAIHVGDSYQDDYEAATLAGIGAIYLDRTGKSTGDIPMVSNLKELLSCVRMP